MFDENLSNVLDLSIVFLLDYEFARPRDDYKYFHEHVKSSKH